MVSSHPAYLRLIPNSPDRVKPSRVVAPDKPHDSFDSAFQSVEKLMKRIVTERVEGPLQGMVLEHLSTGGKFIRARIALKAAMALGLDPARSVNMAAACELLHNATLVHDDLQDGDTIRRGQPTVWVKHGKAQAINVGDVLLMLSTLALENSPVDPQTRWYLAAAMTRRATQTASGQALELSLLERGWLGRDTYLRAARGKSGPFFALPIEAAALSAGHSPGHARLLGDASLGLGALYQVCDDILDIFGDKGRGQSGNDLREGKVSALTVAHLETRPEDEPLLLETLLRPRDETSTQEVNMWEECFKNEGALQGAQQLAAELLSQVDREPALAGEPGLHALVSGTGQKIIGPLSSVASA